MSDTPNADKTADSGLRLTTCSACGSTADAYFSRIEPMGYFCPDCGEESQPDPPVMAWHLNRLKDGKETLLGTFSPLDGQDVMGCDMDEWMRDNGHYGNESPDDYEWEGDAESVAIMAKREGMPEYRFEWRAVFQANTYSPNT
jgi:ribosomal protein S27AE